MQSRTRSVVARRVGPALGLALGLALAGPATAARNMIELATQSGCFLCHSIDAPPSASVVLAPPYSAIADRYRDRKDAFGYLTNRVLHGTVYTEQNWAGRVNMRFMPPNVNVDRADAGALVNWILGLQSGDAANDRFRHHEAMLAVATSSGCFACHKLEHTADSRLMPLAPALRDIAARYKGDPSAADKLLRSIKQGTRAQEKTWHDSNMQFMPPNVALAPETARTLADWILGL